MAFARKQLSNICEADSIGVGLIDYAEGNPTVVLEFTGVRNLTHGEKSYENITFRIPDEMAGMLLVRLISVIRIAGDLDAAEVFAKHRKGDFQA